MLKKDTGNRNVEINLFLVSDNKHFITFKYARLAWDILSF